jgi:lysophospholipase L1-like esterase
VCVNGQADFGREYYGIVMNTVASMIIAKGSQLLIMSSPPGDSSYLFIRQDRSPFKQAPNAKIDSIGKIANKVASKYKTYFFKLNGTFKSMNLAQRNQDLFIKNPRNSGKSDGVHPTSLGYHFIAESIYLFCKENKVLKPEMTIVCFGDSITFGGGDKNAHNYPHYLSQFVNNEVDD